MFAQERNFRAAIGSSDGLAGYSQQLERRHRVLPYAPITMRPYSAGKL